MASRPATLSAPIDGPGWRGAVGTSGRSDLTRLQEQARRSDRTRCEPEPDRQPDPSHGGWRVPAGGLVAEIELVAGEDGSVSEIVDWLQTPHGRNAVDIASRARAISPDPLAVAKCLAKELDLPAAYRAAASLQAELRDSLVARWGETPHWLLTRDGIEQATHPVVRRWRAQRLASLGVGSIADLGCGLGFEAASFAEAGMRVIAVERDLEVSAVAALNLRQQQVPVYEFDVVENEPAVAAVLEQVEAVFVDPARRDPKAARSVDGKSGQRVSSPDAWSPSWAWVQELAQTQPKLVAKVAPGIDRDLLPADSHTTWFSIRNGLVEASVWFSGFGLLPGMQAIAMDRHGDSAAIDSTELPSAAVGALGAFLLDPAPSVTRAGLVEQLAARVNGRRLDPMIGYLTCDEEPADSPLFTTFEVLDAMSFDESQLHSTLLALDARDVQVKARGWGGDVDGLTRKLKHGLQGSKVITLLIARVGDDHLAVLAQRLN